LRVDDVVNPYIRKGVNTYQVNKSGNNINVSFINSLVQLVGEVNDTFTIMNNISQQLKENYCNRNRNTTKNRTINNRLIENLNDGIVMDDLINRIAAIYSVNILIFDSMSETFKFHLALGMNDMYNYINLFKPIIVMCTNNGNYEPVICTITDEDIYEAHRRMLYVRILMDTKIQLVFTEDSRLKDRYDGVLFHPLTVTYFNTWNEYTTREYFAIVDRMNNNRILLDDINHNENMVNGLGGNRRFIEYQ
jgi:hypothetical protein